MRWLGRQKPANLMAHLFGNACSHPCKLSVQVISASHQCKPSATNQLSYFMFEAAHSGQDEIPKQSSVAEHAQDWFRN